MAVLTFSYQGFSCMRFASIGMLLIVFTVGCGGERVASVSGRVTLDGKSLANATVMFLPIATDNANPGPGSQGKTNDKGEFTLKLMTKDVAGAVPGKHKVSIVSINTDTSPDSSKPVQQKEIVPEHYNSASVLTFEVPASGTTTANFELKTSVPMPK